ncbi:Uncharacterised protein r2_g3211 [Pycnogonum litorale]
MAADRRIKLRVVPNISGSLDFRMPRTEGITTFEEDLGKCTLRVGGVPVGEVRVSRDGTSVELDTRIAAAAGDASVAAIGGGGASKAGIRRFQIGLCSWNPAPICVGSLGNDRKN